MDIRTLQHEKIINIENSDILFSINTDSGSYVSSHWHDDVEIIYIIEGSLEINIEDKNIYLRKNMMYIIDSRIIHSVNCSEYNRAVLIQIPHNFLIRFVPDIDNIQFSLNYKKEEYLIVLINRLIELYLDKENNIESRFDFSIEILSFIKNIYRDHSISTKKTVLKNNRYFDRIALVIDYTERNYNKQIGISEIASVASLQDKYFCRFFKRCMGMTYLAYLNEVRLSHLYKDLFDTTEPIGSLIEFHGFNNHKTFRKLFRQKFRMTPIEVRKNNRLLLG